MKSVTKPGRLAEVPMDHVGCGWPTGVTSNAQILLLATCQFCLVKPRICLVIFLFLWTLNSRKIRVNSPFGGWWKMREFPILMKNPLAKLQAVWPGLAAGFGHVLRWSASRAGGNGQDGDDQGARHFFGSWGVIFGLQWVFLDFFWTILGPNLSWDKHVKNRGISRAKFLGSFWDKADVFCQPHKFGGLYSPPKTGEIGYPFCGILAGHGPHPGSVRGSLTNQAFSCFSRNVHGIYIHIESHRYRWLT